MRPPANVPAPMAPPTVKVPRFTSWSPDPSGGDDANLRFWEVPRVGDIVHCRFPDFLAAVLEKHERKTRPALVTGVQEFANGKVSVNVAYGTSQIGAELRLGSILLPASDVKLGLAVDTRFDMRKMVSLPFDTEWFASNPEQRFGLHPKKGKLDLNNPEYRAALSTAVEDAKRLGSDLVDAGPNARAKAKP